MEGSDKLSHKVIGKAHSGVSSGPGGTSNLIMSKAPSVAARLVEENTFTFKPKVSPQSVRIAENLGSDFMSRQQQHIDRQKKNVSRSNMR